MLEDDGPLMLAATDVLRPPQARIAKLGPSLTLPRSVPIRSVAAGIAGFIIGLPASLLGMAFIGLQVFFFLSILFVLAGVFVVQWQPQKGETLLQILGVRARSAMRQQRLEVDGTQMSLSIGMARISRINAGPTRIIPGAVEVVPNSVDERGVIRSARNKNLLPLLPTDYQTFPNEPASPTRLALPELDDLTPEPEPENTPDPSPAEQAEPLLPLPPSSAGGRLALPEDNLPAPKVHHVEPEPPRPTTSASGRLALPDLEELPAQPPGGTEQHLAPEQAPVTPQSPPQSPQPPQRHSRLNLPE